MTARFWIFVNSAPVRVSLVKGKTLSHSTGGATDEGYSRESLFLEFDGRTVTFSWEADARDCDGRMSRSGECYCDVRHLKAGNIDPDDSTVRYPAWEQGRNRQRDYSAEAMGY